MAEKLLQIGLSAGLSLALATGGGPSGCNAEKSGSASGGTGDSGKRAVAPAAPRPTHSAFDYDRTRKITCNGIAWHDNGPTLTFSPEISGTEDNGGRLPDGAWIEGNVSYYILQAAKSRKINTKGEGQLTVTVPDTGVTEVDMVVKWPAGNINEVRECKSWLETRRFNVPNVDYHPQESQPTFEPADAASLAGMLVLPVAVGPFDRQTFGLAA